MWSYCLTLLKMFCGIFKWMFDIISLVLFMFLDDQFVRNGMSLMRPWGSHRDATWGGQQDVLQSKVHNASCSSGVCSSPLPLDAEVKVDACDEKMKFKIKVNLVSLSTFWPTVRCLLVVSGFSSFMQFISVFFCLSFLFSMPSCFTSSLIVDSSYRSWKGDCWIVTLLFQHT